MIASLGFGSHTSERQRAQERLGIQTLEHQPSRLRRTRRRASNPAAPVPTSNSVAGSGVGAGAPGAKS